MKARLVLIQLTFLNITYKEFFQQKAVPLDLADKMFKKKGILSWWRWKITKTFASIFPIGMNADQTTLVKVKNYKTWLLKPYLVYFLCFFPYLYHLCGGILTQQGPIKSDIFCFWIQLSLKYANCLQNCVSCQIQIQLGIVYNCGTQKIN